MRKIIFFYLLFLNTSFSQFKEVGHFKIVLISGNYFSERESHSITQHYRFEVLFEKSLSLTKGESSLNMKAASPNFLDHFIITKTWPNLSVSFPGLVGIDKRNNIYLYNPDPSLKVFDQNGEFIYNFAYPDGYTAAIVLDFEDNLFLFTRLNNNTTEGPVYKISVKDKTKKILSNDEIKQLDSILLPGKTVSDRISKIKVNQGKDGIFYDIKWGKSVNSIFQQQDGKYISPAEIIVYKLDESFDTIYIYHGIPDKYKFDIIDIQNLNNDKIIYINSYKIDPEGNVYVSGIRANEVEKGKVARGN